MPRVFLVTFLVFLATQAATVAQSDPEAETPAAEEVAPESETAGANEAEAQAPEAVEPVPAPVQLEESDLAVMAAVARMYVGPAFGTPLILQAETSTSTPAYREPNPWIVRGAYRFNSALLDFHTRNAETLTLEQVPALTTQVEILSEAELKELSRNGAESRFGKRFPQSSGYLVLSMPGYDSRKRRAFIYAAYHCNGKCTDGGKYFFLNKTKEGWELDRIVSAWWGKPEPPTQASRLFKP